MRAVADALLISRRMGQYVTFTSDLRNCDDWYSMSAMC